MDKIKKNTGLKVAAGIIGACLLSRVVIELLVLVGIGTTIYGGYKFYKFVGGK